MLSYEKNNVRHDEYWLRTKKDCYASHIGCPMETMCLGECELANTVATPGYGFGQPNNNKKLALIVGFIVILTILIVVFLS